MLIKILYILLCLILQTASQLIPSNFSCEKYWGTPYNQTLISGIWYEAARMPASEVPACVKATFPNEIGTDGNLNLRVDYVNNVYWSWERKTENLTFPWKTARNGVFEIQFGNDKAHVNFTFKLITTDYVRLALLCYYPSYIPSITMVKLMTRKQDLSESMKNTMQDYFDMHGVGSQISWVEQGDSCNNAQAISFTTFLLIILLFFMLITQKNHQQGLKF